MFIVHFPPTFCAPEERNVLELAGYFAPNEARTNNKPYYYKHLAPLERRHILRVAPNT